MPLGINNSINLHTNAQMRIIPNKFSFQQGNTFQIFPFTLYWISLPNLPNAPLRGHHYSHGSTYLKGTFSEVSNNLPYFLTQITSRVIEELSRALTCSYKGYHTPRCTALLGTWRMRRLPDSLQKIKKWHILFILTPIRTPFEPTDSSFDLLRNYENKSNLS